MSNLDLKATATLELNAISSEMVGPRIMNVADQTLSLLCDIIPSFDILNVCLIEKIIHITFDIGTISGGFEVDEFRIVLNTDTDGVERKRVAYYKDDYLFSVERWVKSFV